MDILSFHSKLFFETNSKKKVTESQRIKETKQNIIIEYRVIRQYRKFLLPDHNSLYAVILYIKKSYTKTTMDFKSQLKGHARHRFIINYP